MSFTPEVIDFRSRAFVRACRDAGIKIIWRIPGEPHYGGHIERLIGTMMGAVHLLPGTTQANPGAKEDYKSDKAARLTLRELERWIGHEVAGRYHNSVHSSLKRPPIAVWRDHEAKLPLRMPVDRMAFWVAFLPEQERTLRPDGIHLFGLTYWSSVLTADVGRLKKKMLVKYDPRDLSRIFVLRPSGHFIEARYGDITLPAISLAPDFGGRLRMPGPSSGVPMNSMPAASKVAAICRNVCVRLAGTPSTASNLLIVRTPKPDLSASSSIVHRSAARADLICVPQIIDKRP